MSAKASNNKNYCTLNNESNSVHFPKALAICATQ